MRFWVWLLCAYWFRRIENKVQYYTFYVELNSTTKRNHEFSCYMARNLFSIQMFARVHSRPFFHANELEFRIENGPMHIGLMCSWWIWSICTKWQELLRCDQYLKSTRDHQLILNRNRFYFMVHVRIIWSVRWIWPYCHICAWSGSPILLLHSKSVAHALLYNRDATIYKLE